MNQINPSVKKCPYCAEQISYEAIKCRHCGSWLDRSQYLKGWTRSRRHAKLLGICAGLANQMAIPVLFIRLTFIVFSIIGGWGVIIYLALWLLMPWDSEEEKKKLKDNS